MTSSQPTPAWRKRPATAEDQPFLKRLFVETNEALQFLPPPLREGLAEMQYGGREMTYGSQFPDASDSIICLVDGTAVGRQLTAHVDGALRLVDVAILPAWQGRGLGGAVLRALLDEAAREQARVELRVARGNPAVRLYERLGFKMVDADAVSLEFRWEA